MQDDDERTRGDRTGRRADPFSSGGRPGIDGLGDLFGAKLREGLRESLRGGRAGGGSGGSALFERIVGDVSSWFDDGRDGGARRGKGGSTADPASAERAPRDTPARDENIDRNVDYDDEARDALHRGRGPKGYRRADERLVEIVSDALYEADDLDARGIEVAAKKGDVKLSGRVPTRRQKHRAENLAARAAGVHDVDNRLRVKRRAGAADGKRSDDASSGARPLDGAAGGQPGGTPGEASRDDDDYGHPR